MKRELSISCDLFNHQSLNQLSTTLITTAKSIQRHNNLCPRNFPQKGRQRKKKGGKLNYIKPLKPSKNYARINIFGYNWSMSWHQRLDIAHGKIFSLQEKKNEFHLLSPTMIYFMSWINTDMSSILWFISTLKWKKLRYTNLEKMLSVWSW